LGTHTLTHSQVREKIYIVCGKEFGDDLEGQKAIIVRALYGLKSSGAAWRACLAEVLHDQLGFRSYRADNDVWLRVGQRADGSRYYEYVLVYTDDILCLSCGPKAILDHLDQHFLLKPGSIGPPMQYLGASISKYKHASGDKSWSMGSQQYIKEAVRRSRVEVYETVTYQGSTLAPYERPVFSLAFISSNVL
jgi:Reverse transcriptase (RNA-dependent DNA polymerase)